MAHITPNLKQFERQVYSQFGEDGVLERIALDLGINKGTFFEFGVSPKSGFHAGWTEPLEGNFVLLREKGWEGVFVDIADMPASYGVRRGRITPLNINKMYQDYGLTDDLDFMSIDVDGQDFWIWLHLRFRPKLMIVEYNGAFDKDQSFAVQFDVHFGWDGTEYQGASLAAYAKLADAKGYHMVYANGVNAIFLREDCVSNPDDFPYNHLFLKSPHHQRPDPMRRAWVRI